MSLTVHQYHVLSASRELCTKNIARNNMKVQADSWSASLKLNVTWNPSTIEKYTTNYWQECNLISFIGVFVLYIVSVVDIYRNE